MSTTSIPSTEPQQTISGFGRISGVLFSPKATFEDIVRKPTWILPVIIMTVLGLLVAVALNQRMDWRAYMAQQIEKSPRAEQMSPEQKQQQINAGAKFAPISTYVFGVPFPVVVVLVISAIMLGAYNLLGGANTNFKTSLGIVSHAFVPTFISSLLLLLVLFLKPFGTVDINNPVATNLAAFLPESAPKWLDALCKNLDVFAFWSLILMAIGFAATNPKKMKGGKSFSIAFTMLAVWIVLRMGIAFIFS